MQKRRTSFKTIIFHLIYLKGFRYCNCTRIFVRVKKCQLIDLANPCSCPPLVYLLIAQTCVFVYDLFSFLYTVILTRYDSLPKFLPRALYSTLRGLVYEDTVLALLIIIVRLTLKCFSTGPQKQVPSVNYDHLLGSILG